MCKKKFTKGEWKEGKKQKIDVPRICKLIAESKSNAKHWSLLKNLRLTFYSRKMKLSFDLRTGEMVSQGLIGPFQQLAL